MLSYEQAREKVIEVSQALRRLPTAETIELAAAAGRVLAETVVADRDYPPFDRSTRDGFAVRAADAAPGATLAVIGESRAGNGFGGEVAAGQCVEIMTGAPAPRGADAVVMVEYTRADAGRVTLERGAERGENIVPRGIEARAGQQLVAPGTRLGIAELALAAQVGCARVGVFRRPRVAILSTGDEVVDVAATPGALQIRNSNGLALEALAALAGAEPVSLGHAGDDQAELRRRIERGLEADLLVLSGGVSKGKYDLVEAALADLGAEFFFDAVAIRPGQPTVFGSCRGKPVLGLPGNPISTIVTCELFAVPVIDVLGGAAPRALPTLRARLAHPLRERGSHTRFLPARVSHASHDGGHDAGGEAEVSTLRWQGSGDLAALAQANAFLVVPPEKSEWAAGEWAAVILRRGFGGEWC